MRILILILLILLPNFMEAQVVNIERLRNYSPKKFSGEINFSFSAVKNTREILNFSNSSIIQFSPRKYIVSLFTNYSWLQINKTKVISNGFQHLRFTFRKDRKLEPEFLLQNQQNPIWDIDTRILVGAGSLFLLKNSDTLLITIGSYLLYEYEDLIQDTSINKNFRLSISPHFSIKKEKVNFNFILYYQPIPTELLDYRISGEVNISIALFKKISFTNSFTLNYDTKPPVNLPEVFYNYRSGIRLNF